MVNHSVKQLITLLCFTVAAIAHAETPQEAAQVIHGLIKAENYTELFTTRYSEWHKVESEGIAPAKAVEMLSGGLKKRRETMLSIYRQLSEANFTISTSETPQVSETGQVATAKVKIGEREGPFKIYEMKNGLWGFHL